MFIEFVDPQILDDMSTRDRIKIRMGEPGVSGRFWANLVFYSRKDLKRFAEKLLEYAEEPKTTDLSP